MKKVGVKKILALLLVLVLSFALLCGCGAAKPATDTTTDTPDTTSNDTTSSDTTMGDAPDTIKIGFVVPLSGPMANFTVGIYHAADLAIAAMNADGGMYIAEYDQKIPVEVIWGDSESSSTKASEVATKLATEDKVSILVGEWTPDTANPVSIVAERYKIPALVSGAPDSSWLANGPYEWSFALLFSYDNFIDEYFAGFDTLETNKKVGIVLDSSVDGIGMAELLAAKADARGYEIVDPGRFPVDTTDYTAVIAQIQDAGCDILIASMFTPQLVTIWNQCQQLGYQPKIVVLSKGMHLSADVPALGDGAWNFAAEPEWSPEFPYTSSLLGLTAQELSDDFEAVVKQAPDLTIGWDYSLFDVIADVLGRAQSLDPTTLRDTFATTDLDTIYGHVAFRDDHVSIVPICFGQWVPDDTWGVHQSLVGADHVPELADLTVPLLPMEYK